MKMLWWSLVVGLLCVVAAKEEDVVELTDADFDNKLRDYETALVMFYAPWCGHCKRLKPEYAKAAESLIRHTSPVILAKVDCTEGGKETCTKHSVSGYPTLKVFRNGELSQDYAGPREAAGIVKYMKAQVGPASRELTTVEELLAFIDSEEVGVVGFFEKESDLKAVYLKLADQLREKIRFAHTSHKDLIKEQELKNGVVLYRPSHLHSIFEEPAVTYVDPPYKTALNDFITKQYHGLVGHRKSDNRQDFHNPLVVVYYSVDYVKNAKGTNYWRNRVLKVAKLFSEHVNFAVSDKDELKHEINEYGIDHVPEDKPLVLARDADNKKYVMTAPFSVENLNKFVKDLIDGALVPYLKSEAVPENNDEPVKVAVAKNFNELIIDNGKDTLIEFYAPWCGHCQKLSPIYDELATKLQNEDVVIAKMDATANDVPSTFDVRGFPTLFFLPKDAKDRPVQYSGPREVDDFIKYIAEKATEELKGYDRNGKPKKSEL